MKQIKLNILPPVMEAPGVKAATKTTTADAFLVGMAIVYLCAFTSLYPQLPGCSQHNPTPKLVCDVVTVIVLT